MGTYDIYEQAQKELQAERSPVDKAIDWAKDVAEKYHLVPDSVSAGWRAGEEEKKYAKACDIQDRINDEWGRSPEGQKWEREQEEQSRDEARTYTSIDHAEKRADLENDPTIDRGDVNWMMAKWAGDPNWREIADRNNESELHAAREHEERMVSAWEKSPEGKAAERTAREKEIEYMVNQDLGLADTNMAAAARTIGQRAGRGFAEQEAAAWDAYPVPRCDREAAEERRADRVIERWQDRAVARKEKQLSKSQDEGLEL